MHNKTLGIILIVISGLILYSEHEAAPIISAILIGIGSAIFFFLERQQE